MAGTILTRGTPPLQGGPVPYSGSFGANPGGVILAIENGENFAIELVGDGNTTDDCGKNSDKTKVLPPHGRISTTELKALFGSEQPRYPRSLYGCSYVDRPLGIGLSITAAGDVPLALLGREPNRVVVQDDVLVHAATLAGASKDEVKAGRMLHEHFSRAARRGVPFTSGSP